MLSMWNSLLTDDTVCRTNKITARNGYIAQHQDLSVGRPLLMLGIKILLSHTWREFWCCSLKFWRSYWVTSLPRGPSITNPWTFTTCCKLWHTKLTLLYPTITTSFLCINQCTYIVFSGWTNYGMLLKATYGWELSNVQRWASNFQYWQSYWGFWTA